MGSINKNDILLDALIKAAISDKFQNEIDALPSNEELNELYKPSSKLEKHIKKLINNHYRKLKIKSFSEKLVKVVASVVIGFALLLTGLLSVGATRNVIINTIIEWNEKYVRIEFKSLDDSSQNDIYQPSWLPQGFSQNSVKEIGNVHMLIYTNDNDETIIINQWEYGKATSTLDNENKNFLEIEVSGNKAYFLEAITDDEPSILTWQSGNRVIELISPIDSKDLIHIAESLKK